MIYNCILRFFMCINPKLRHTVNEIRKSRDVIVTYDSDSD